ncbi:hypothetical protein H9X57_04215 [Flavobacterium piscinae]|uniref:hypothetical protein n=1 Tax=Flavobacterium piscinae TaxID=2506424 RepID=UPI0019B10C30|nr:hypothetical protein [Flavobacterium piscinae]MBC8882863.1 hypothetical protein [Flavobacterium piscinae]
MKFAADNYGNLVFKYKDSVKPDYLFRYAHALKGLEDYERGDKIMSDYLKYPVDTKKFKEHLNNIVPYNYKVNQMTRSTSTGDFGISIFGRKLFLLRSEMLKVRYTNGMKNLIWICMKQQFLKTVF